MLQIPKALFFKKLVSSKSSLEFQMKISLYILLSSLFLNCSNNSIYKEDVDTKLEELLNKRDYFNLNSLLEANKENLKPERGLYFQVFISKAFGEKDKSTLIIDNLINDYGQSLSDTTIVKLLDIKASNNIYMYQYKNASDIYSTILSEYKGVIDSVDIVNYQNLQSLFKAVANVKPQRMVLTQDALIESKRNAFNHLLSPVTINKTTQEFIFDTGANFSTIPMSQAKKMNLKLIEQKIDVGSSTKMKIESTLAVADSLFFGDILFENVVFLVMPDEQLTFPELNYKINGIIGFPVIHQLGEVHLNSDGTIKVPLKRTKRSFKNLFFDGLNPVVRGYTKNDTLLFTFDTGAGHSELSYKYFYENKDYIGLFGEQQTNQRGGAGGKVDVEEYILNDFPLKIGSKQAKLPTIPVTLEEYEFNKYFDGNLGQDYIGKFNSLILNFEYMYIDFE